MDTDRKNAAVDTDFLIHIAESKLDDALLTSTLQTIFTELNLLPVVYLLVYENEFPSKSARVELLLKNNTLSSINYPEVFNGDTDKEEYYLFLVKELYRSLTAKAFPIPDEKIFSEWKSGECFGEVHILSLCLIGKYGIFLSDDGDAKHLRQIIDKKSLGSVEVYNRSELVDKHMQEGATPLNREVRRALTHPPESDSTKINHKRHPRKIVGDG